MKNPEYPKEELTESDLIDAQGARKLVEAVEETSPQIDSQFVKQNYPEKPPWPKNKDGVTKYVRSYPKWKKQRLTEQLSLDDTNFLYEAGFMKTPGLLRREIREVLLFRGYSEEQINGLFNSSLNGLMKKLSDNFAEIDNHEDSDEILREKRRVANREKDILARKMVRIASRFMSQEKPNEERSVVKNRESKSDKSDNLDTNGGNITSENISVDVPPASTVEVAENRDKTDRVGIEEAEQNRMNDADWMETEMQAYEEGYYPVRKRVTVGKGKKRRNINVTEWKEEKALVEKSDETKPDSVSEEIDEKNIKTSDGEKIEAKTVMYGDKERRVDVLERYAQGVQTELERIRDDFGKTHKELYANDDVYNQFYKKYDSLRARVRKLSNEQNINETNFNKLKEEFDSALSELRRHIEDLKTEKQGGEGEEKKGEIQGEGKEESKELDSSQNGELKVGDSGRAIIGNEAKIVKVIGINRDGTLTVSQVEKVGDNEEIQREVVAAEDFQLFDYEIRRRLRQEYQGTKEEFAKLYKQRSHKWVGRWIGLNPRGYKEKLDKLNAAKAKYNEELKAALKYRAENRLLSREAEAARESAAHLEAKGENIAKIPGAERVLERKKLIETHYNPWFIKRNVLDDAVWRYELRKSKLSPEKQAVLKKMRKVAQFTKKHKWAVRAGVVTAAGAAAAGSALVAGGMVGSAILTGGSASLTRGGRMLFGATVGAGAAATTYGVMSEGVWMAENKLNLSLDNVKRHSYQKKIEEMDEIEMQAMVDEYIKNKGDLDKAALKRTVATAGVGLGAGAFAGANFDDVVDFFEDASVFDRETNVSVDPTPNPHPPEVTLTPHEDTTSDITETVTESMEAENEVVETATPEKSITPNLPDFNNMPEQTAVPTAEKVSVVDLPDFSAEHEADVASAPEVMESPATEEMPIFDKSLNNPPQMLSVPEGSSPSEALWKAYLAGDLTGLPEDISRAEFENKMWAAFHAFDDNETIVMDRMGMDRPDVDFIRAGDSFNVTPIIEHMNGHSLEEIESGVYEQEDLLSRTGETDRTTTPEESPRPQARPENLATSESAAESAEETVAAAGKMETAIDPVEYFEAQSGLDDLTEQKLHTEFSNRVAAENIPAEEQEAFAKVLVDRTYIEQRMDALQVFGEKVSASEFLDMQEKWSDYDAFSVKTPPFDEDKFQEYLDFSKGLQKQDLLIDGESIKTSIEEGIKNGRIEVTDKEVLLKKQVGLLRTENVLSVATLRKA